MKTISEYIQKKHIKSEYAVNPRVTNYEPQQFDAYKITWPSNNVAYGVIKDNITHDKNFSECYFTVNKHGNVDINTHIGIHEPSNNLKKLNDMEISMLNKILNYYFDNKLETIDTKDYIIGHVTDYKFTPA